MKRFFLSGRVDHCRVHIFFIVLFLCVSCGGGGPLEPPIEPAGFVGRVKTVCAEDLVLHGEFAYVADGPGGLKVINISSPSNPSLVRTIQTTYAFRVYIYQEHLYLCDASAGLKVYSLAEPSNPTLTFSRDTNWATSASFRNGYCYQGDYYGGLLVYRVDNPANPVFVAEKTRTKVRDTFFLGNLLLTSEAPFGIAPYRLDSPTDLTLTFSSTDRVENYEDIVGFNGHAIIARNNYSSNLSVYNMLDPENPERVNTIFSARFIEGLTIDANVLIASCGEDGVIAYSMAGLPAIPPLWRVNTPGYARRAKLSGNHIFVADMSYFRIYDITEIGGRS